MSLEAHLKDIAPNLDPGMEYFSQFHISSNGFLPAEPPLAELTNMYYVPWESLVRNLPTLLAGGTFRGQADALPVLSTDLLQTESERRRAYVVLCFLAHAYIWGGRRASEILPPQITIPLLSISEALSLPPVATYAALNLWNWSSSTPWNLESIKIPQTFTGTPDEAWFYAVSIAVEAQGARLMARALLALEAADREDFSGAIPELHTLARGIADLAALVERMAERCDPGVFYTRIRPFLAGSRNMACAGLPRGVFYDEGGGKGVWRALRGGSNGQSSLVQFLDAVLGVVHNGGFHEEVRGYMPLTHRRFLEYVVGRFPGGMRGLLMRDLGGGLMEGRAKCRVAFRETTEALAAFRGKHLQMVTRYIIIPSRQVVGEREGAVNLAKASSGQRAGKIELTGTGGTALLPFLKQTRDETFRAGLMA